MKQKRKVKSLIPSKSGSNVFLTTLLFLLGGILCLGAVRLFTSSMGVEAADEGSIEYPGIADKHEVLLKFGLIPKGGDTPINEMYLTGTTFVVSGDNGISVNIGNSNDLDKYVNYLGGDGGMNISSDNITIIGGSADEIYENNDDATVLGGMHNKVDEGNNNASPVILGGEGRNDDGYKTIGKNQEGSAVVGGQNNEIKDNGSYDFILGGENNKIDGSNVIVGGSRINVDEKSNVFAFSHGDSPFEPESENAFYLNLKNGLGLNREAVNNGVDSNGAVSFGEVNIVTQKCTSADKGVQGTWQGCLVGCTETSAALSPSKWEMIDHGTGCEKICENNSSYCMINPIKIEVKSYQSYCTNIGVDTGNSHHCGGEENILPKYENVLFETTLIDSEATCPDPSSPNRCVFKCDGGYHLERGSDGRSRCYKDCELVWDHSSIKHNETVTAYKRTDANCSYNSDSQKGPYTCKNYKATLVCDDGTLKVKQSFASSTENGKDAYDLGYQYDECMLHQYRCPATYNYSKSEIGSKFDDAPANDRWNIQNRQNIVGTRGTYKLCVDYDAVTLNTVQYLNGEICFERDKNADSSYNLHYQWLGCNNHYHTGSRSNYVCMADCTLKDPNGTTRYYLHETRITGYKNGSVDCGSAGNGKCESETLVCNDGKWRKGSLNGAETDDYKYNDCSLNDFDCVLTEYNVDESTKTAHQGESVYASSCISYDGQDDKVTCSKRRTDYKLTNCVGGHSTYHTENNMRCISNEDERQCTHAGATVSHHFHYINALVPVRWSGTAYNNGTWSTPANCSWKCDTNYHEDEEEGDCISNSRNVDCSDYYTLPSNASWDGQGYQTWNTTRGRWNDPLYCSWSCIGGWHENSAGTACEKDCTVVSCSAYTLDECPDKGVCSYCTKVNSSCNDGETKAKLDYCVDDYEVSSDGTSCEYNPSCYPNYCSAYGLDECPEGGNCSWCRITDDDCIDGDWKAQLNSCEDGYEKEGNNCIPKDPMAPGDGGADDDPTEGEDYSCEGPCGSADDGESLTCYKPGVQCTSTTTTAPSQTRSCNGGSWSSSFNSTYTDSEPDLSSKTCNSSTYPLTTEPDATNGTKTPCTPYSQDGTKNACKAGTTRYKLTCNEGYELSNDGLSCQPIGGVRPGGEEDQEDCSVDTRTKGSCTFSIPALSDGDSTTVEYTTSPYYGTTTAKCTNGSLSYTSESCITVCGSSGNPAGCNGSFSALGYPGITWGSSYSYTCKYGSLNYSCSANCPTGQYWKGTTEHCGNPSGICASTHNNCTNGGSYVSNSAGSTSTTYTWKCKRGDYTEGCTEPISSCTYDERDKQGCTDPHPGNPEGNWSESTCSCTCPKNSTFGGEYGCECNQGYEFDGNSGCVEAKCTGLPANATPNNNSKPLRSTAYTYSTNTSKVCTFQCDSNYTRNPNTSKCEQSKNYTIVNGTSLNGRLCTRALSTVQLAEYVSYSNLPRSEQEACAGYDPNSHEDCYHDYLSSYDGDSQMYYSCSSVSISSCGTTDYANYCSNNPGGKCYISDTEVGCTSATICYSTSMCGGNCGAAPAGGCYTEKECKGSMQYVQCK